MGVVYLFYLVYTIYIGSGTHTVFSPRLCICKITKLSNYPPVLETLNISKLWIFLATTWRNSPQNYRDLEIWKFLMSQTTANSSNYPRSWAIYELWRHSLWTQMLSRTPVRMSLKREQKRLWDFSAQVNKNDIFRQDDMSSFVKNFLQNSF